jgi:phosphate transport system substrate-binding protein
MTGNSGAIHGTVGGFAVYNGERHMRRSEVLKQRVRNDRNRGTEASRMRGMTAVIGVISTRASRLRETSTRARAVVSARARAVVVAGSALLLAAALTTLPAAAEPIRLGGTGSGLGTMQRLAEAYARKDPSVRIVVVPNLGSSGGIKALQAGAVELAVTSRAPKTEELASGLQAFEYGRSPFVFVTNGRSSGNTISRHLAAQYFSGRISQWPDGTPVRLVLRPATDGDTALQEAFSAEMAEAVKAAHARPGMVIANTDQDAADEAQRLPGSLATNTLALLLSEQRHLRVLTLDGIVPSVKTLADGAYPYHKPLYLVRRAADAPPDVQRFIDFVRSGEGRALLEKLGHWVP